MAKATRYDPIRIGNSTDRAADDQSTSASRYPVDRSRLDGSTGVAPYPTHFAYRIRARLVSYWLTGGATALTVFELVRK